MVGNLRVVSLFLLAFTTPVFGQTEKVLTDFPFWQKSAGVWESENTYMDADMNYLVRSYSSLVRIELRGRQYVEVEHRFYPAGQSTDRYGQGLMGPGEGVELVVNTTAELIDDKGTLGNIIIDHAGSSQGPNAAYRVMSNNDAVRINTNPETGVDNYRMYFNFTTPDRRYRSNFGLLGSDETNLGGLRAFILYRDKRINAADFESRRQALRQRYNVKVISVADPDPERRSIVSRLD